MNYGDVFDSNEPLTDWQIDPNPFKDRIWIGFNSKSEQTGTFNLYDLTGKLVLDRKLAIQKVRMDSYLNQKNCHKQELIFILSEIIKTVTTGRLSI